MTAGSPTLSHQGKKTVLSAGETLIGSSSECGVQIQGQGVAPVHAAVVVEGSRVLLEDRSPDQETRVNDQRASVVQIDAGSSLKFGEVELQVVREGSGYVLQGPAGKFTLATGENKVGRAPDCRVTIDDASISRYHAVVLVLPNRILVKDLASTNGTVANGRTVGTVELATGDKIKLGEVEVTFEQGAAAEPVLFELQVDGSSRVLTPGDLTVGRAPDCKISFTDDAGVSRHHAQLTVGADSVRLRDLGSSNGTFVNGSQISGETTLNNGDRVTIGEHELILKAKVSVDPLGKTVLASNLGSLADKTVLMTKGTAKAAAAAASAGGAWAVFDLAPGASEEQIRQRYQERYSEYQVRLTNAPTPKLKEKYSQKLQELKSAFAELVPNVAGASASDLPSAKPVVVPKAKAKPTPPAAEPESPAQAPATAPPAAAIEEPKKAKKAKKPKKAKAAAPVATEKEPLPRSAIIMAGLGVLALAFGIVMTVLLLGAKKVEANLASTIETKTQAIARMQQETVDTQQGVETIEGGKATLLQNKPFKVCNLSTKGDLRIKWLAVAYIGPDGKMASFDSAFAGYKQWTVSAGGSTKFDFVSDDEVIWDGSALFFSMLFKYRGKEYHRSGAMHDVPDDCYKLALD